MSKQTVIGRRIESALAAYVNKDFETSLLHLFPVLDKTARKRRPKAKVGDRIRSFIADEEDLITYLAIGNIIKGVHSFGVRFPEAVYKYGRCSIEHEGELDPRLKIIYENRCSIGKEWELPYTFIIAMIMSVILAEENKNDILIRDMYLTFFDKKFILNKLWGQSKNFRNDIGLTALMTPLKDYLI
ncbi:hypothetical protein [Enterobacter cloacae]|uniref:hypothetical protein n=1 Tax=Enterobacter cloacae TaxID=550 RepID=UPI003F478D17